MVTQIDYSIYQVCEIIGGQWLMKTKDSAPEYLSLDSRRINDPSATLFWAIANERRDASVFIKDLYHLGVRNFVSQSLPDMRNCRDCNVILVENSLQALQQLAVFHRKRFRKIHVIGITGSNGKTIVKEWLSDLLSAKYQVVKSPRSFNSQVGVPLSILQIRKHHQFGIFEAGISQPGEMSILESMIRPSTGILTNIGSAHDEGFLNRNEKIREKLFLFKNAKSLVLPANKLILEEIEKFNLSRNLNLLTWGRKDAECVISSTKKQNDESTIVLQYKLHTYPVTIPFSDKGSIENAVSCFGALAAAGKLEEKILKKFQSLSGVAMRLEMKPGIGRSAIVNDSYSNDIQSLGIAVDFLCQQKYKSHTVIISDILQSGLPADLLYERVSQILNRPEITRLIAIGKEIGKYNRTFSFIEKRFFFEDTQAFLKALSGFNFHDEAVLIKGARDFAFEKISRLLETKIHQTVLTVNLSNLAHNIRIYKQLLNPATRVMIMVKAFAYGTGSQEISSVLEFIKADYLAVAFTDEGAALRANGIQLPIMVMNAEIRSFDVIVANHLEPEIFSFQILEYFSDYLKKRKIYNYPVHIKIDTGMHRLGFVPGEIKALIRTIRSIGHIKIASVFSHFSSADEPKHDNFTKAQFRIFKKIVGQFKSALPYAFLSHIANSSAISRFPGLQCDMVRLGIGMYGIDKSLEIRDRLKVVNRLTTTISQIKKVKAGDVVGYGKNVIKEDATIAIISIGYADGFPRILSNGRGKVWVGGGIAPVIGNICMDMTMVDITAIKNVHEGDEVEIFGENIPVSKVAKWAQTIPYEILTGISERVRRIYIEE